jgi:hypothetical protein
MSERVTKGEQRRQSVGILDKRQGERLVGSTTTTTTD